MTLDFQCKKCRSPMQTPDSAAGKKGRCGDCDTVMNIPYPAPASGAWQDFDESQVYLVEQSTTGKMKDGIEALRFNCLRCEKQLWLYNEKAHKKIECSGCGIIMRLSNAAATSSVVTAVAPVSEDDGIRFQCPHCQHGVRVDSRFANQKGKCPECQAVVDIPKYSKLVRVKDPTPMAINPLGIDTAVAVDNEDPLMAGSWDASPGFAEASPMVSWDGSRAGTGGGGASQFQQRTRSGMPWEDESWNGSRFWGTARGVLLSPDDTFGRMKREGEVGPALRFAVAGMMLGGAALILYGLVAMAIGVMGLEAGKKAEYGLLMKYMGLGTLAVIAATSLGTLALVFLLSTVHHLALILAQSTSASLGTTIRVVSYAIGSVGVTQIGLILFPLALLISLPISLKKGSEEVHGASSGQAMIALLISFSIIAAFVIAILVMIKLL
jgi:transcription initiation factor IIE alpha subunit